MLRCLCSFYTTPIQLQRELPVDHWSHYGVLMVTGALGSSNISQVVDLNLNSNPFTPGSAIYQNGVPPRGLIINFMDDGGTGSAAYIENVHIGGQNTGEADTTPHLVTVRYLVASSMNEKSNITWAGQTTGREFQRDGRLGYGMSCSGSSALSNPGIHDER